MKDVYEWIAGTLIGVVILFAGWLKISSDRKIERMQKEIDSKAAIKDVEEIEDQIKEKVDADICGITSKGITDSINGLKKTQERFIDKMDERLLQGSQTMHRLELLITEIKKNSKGG